MMKKQRLSTRAGWMLTLALVAAHPLLLYLLYPLIGERSNLVVMLAPFAAAWQFGWLVGIGAAFINTIVTSLFFSLVGGQTPDDRIKGIVAFLVVSSLCVGLDRLKHFMNKGEAMADELERMRRPFDDY